MEYCGMDDNMQESVDKLGDALVGKKIVSAEELHDGGVKWKLDDGKIVYMEAINNCCAGAGVDELRLNIANIDNVITSVIARDNYQEWTVLAAGIPVAELDVGWSEGTGYYSYGFSVEVYTDKNWVRASEQ